MSAFYGGALSGTRAGSRRGYRYHCGRSGQGNLGRPAVVSEEVGRSAAGGLPVHFGIGGGLDQAALLAKKALLWRIDSKNPDQALAKLEDNLLKSINRLNIGPMGLGGGSTCLGVNIKTHPTHIAGLPVAVNISCHALRSARKRL